MVGNTRQHKITSGLIWTFGERITAQLVSTVVTIILARLLDPEHYGMISIVTVFITICNVFVTSGFGTAIVQKKEVDEKDYNSAFSVSFVISILVYFLIFIIAPYVSNFYDMPDLTSVMRVMAIRLPIAAVNTIQQASIQREMAFKKFFIATSFGTIISGFVGIAMAYYGFGVWALVGQYLTNTSIDTIVLLFVGKWIPKPQFSIKKAKEIYSFGWKVLLTELVYTVENDIRSLLIGKVYGSQDLAFFDQGKKYPALIVQNVNASINKVMLPAYSQRQDDIIELKTLLRKSIQIGMFFMAPLLMGLAAVSNTFVILALTEKWAYCIPFIKIFCLSFVTRPLESSCHQALLGIGKNKAVLKIMILINVIDLILVFIFVFIVKSVFLIAVGSLITSIVSLLCFLYQTNKYINYTFNEQMSDLLPSILIAGVMAIVCYVLGFIHIPLWLVLIIQILVGACIYLTLSAIFRISGFRYCLSMFRRIISNRI